MAAYSSSDCLALPPGPVMVDIEGPQLQAHERARLRHPLVGGVILFARNFCGREALHALCAEIHGLRSPPLLIAVDHEGGRVQRFREDGFTHLPPMAALGRLWNTDAPQALALATHAGHVLAAELRACGVDLSFTPVLDLDHGLSEVIGSRAFHARPEAVVALARALIEGLGQAGMAACGKHFPGHGAVTADSHHAIPVDGRTRAAILALDAWPYPQLGSGLLPAIMPAHVIYPQVDGQPAGFSRVWLQDILRSAMAYDGIIFSDDLTMEGARVAGDILGRAQAALQAGCDMVLVCNRPDLADQLLAQLAWQPAPDWPARLARLMPSRPALPWARLQTDKAYQHAREQLRSEALSC